MISTETKAQTTKKSINQQHVITIKPNLEARWSTVEGKLVCQWVKA
ncbi:MAG: hypothetical protein AAGE84_26980 [Cyanobacteria bacterium P01_G01_bin.39]